MNQPKISVIIPVFNGEKFIAEAIQSVREQNYKPLEIIVIDDGSTDNTMDVVKSLGGEVVIFSQPNKGVAAARNAGLERATGDLITFIDADDVWLQNKLHQQTSILNNNPEIEIVIGFLLILEFNNREEVTNEQITTGKSAMVFQLGSALIRKSVFDKIGRFDTEFGMAEDSDWFFRVMEADIKVQIMEDIVQLYRQHNNNITKDKTMTNSYLLKAFKKSLDRRRKAGISGDAPLPVFGNIEQVKQFWLKKQQ